jgi:hypothetical protein
MSILIRGAASSAIVALSFVTIARVVDIPSGVSVRALQEGRVYPPRCR